MKKLGGRGRAWLMGFHVIFAGAWVGAAACLVLLLFVKVPADDGGTLHGVLDSAKLVDDLVIIPAALGSLFTGLLISLFTNWGFFRHRWVTVKWAATVTFVLFGTFFLGPWLNGMAALADGMREGALADPAFARDLLMNRVFGSAQALLLMALVFITELKPWGKKREKSAKSENK